MPRLPTIPHEPLARFRLLSVSFAAAVAFVNTGFFAFASGLGSGARWEGAAAATVLGAWWIYGYRRGGFPVAGWLADAALLVLVAVHSTMPLHAIALFYAGIQLRALYVARRDLALLPVSYAVARVATVAIAQPTEWGAALSGPLIVQVLGLAAIAITLHVFAESTTRHSAIERALKRSDERYQLVARATRDVVYDWNIARGSVEWTESMHTVFGFPAEPMGTTVAWWMEKVHPEDRGTLERAVAAVLEDATLAVRTVRYRVRRADGVYAHVSASMIVERAPDGSPTHVVGSIRDVTSEQQLEQRLSQSQKLEAVGQLAGGVAHDFNNLLTVIGGHVYMLRHDLPRNTVTDKHLTGITRASERAASLTRQLLAFSRKQILTPSVLDVNTVIDDVVAMVRPAIGEHIQVTTDLDPLLQPVLADPGQLEQVLINLALNARDAMPDGGSLTIATTNVTIHAKAGDSASLPAGDYIRVIVRDSGTGMDAATLRRAFEPFFTTKAHGHGTGLGLATVYGIIKQSLGDIHAASTPGAGSTFTILLPVAPGAAPRAPVPTPAAEADPMPTARRLNVLLVEDDSGVRDFAFEVLARAGHNVRSAHNGVDALALIDSGDAVRIDLVVTDVVMPEMGGREMVAQLRARQPDLAVLYMTGYTDDWRMVAELQRSDARLLEKPFSALAFERAVIDATKTTMVPGLPEPA